MPFAEVIPHYILFPNAPQHKLQVHLCKDANLCYLNPCSQFVDDIQQTLLYDKGDAWNVTLEVHEDLFYTNLATLDDATW